MNKQVLINIVEHVNSSNFYFNKEPQLSMLGIKKAQKIAKDNQTSKKLTKKLDNLANCFKNKENLKANQITKKIKKLL